MNPVLNHIDLLLPADLFHSHFPFLYIQFIALKSALLALGFKYMYVISVFNELVMLLLGCVAAILLQRVLFLTLVDGLLYEDEICFHILYWAKLQAG